MQGLVSGLQSFEGMAGIKVFEFELRLERHVRRRTP